MSPPPTPAYFSQNFIPDKHTKPQLRSFLSELGVALPAGEVKKQVLIDLWEEQGKRKVEEERMRRAQSLRNKNANATPTNNANASRVENAFQSSGKKNQQQNATTASNKRSPSKTKRTSPQKNQIYEITDDEEETVQQLQHTPITNLRFRHIEETPGKDSPRKIVNIPATPHALRFESPPKQQPHIAPPQNHLKWLWALIMIPVITIAASLAIYQYRLTTVDYCDTGIRVEFMSSGFFDLPPCRTCPPHTKCRDGVMTDCQESYVLQKEWNGLVCVPDVINLKYAEKVSSEIVSMTETLDGQKICEDKLPGTGAEELREGVRRNHASWTDKHFENIWSLATKDIANRPNHWLVDMKTNVSPDDSTSIVFVSRYPAVSWTCWVRRTVIAGWDSIKWYVAYVATTCLAIYLGLRHRQKINARAKMIDKLCKDVFYMLKTQKEAHTSFPRNQPAGLALDQIRDALMPQFTIQKRHEIWKDVCEAVRQNVSVREMPVVIGGEDFLCWEWIGWGVLDSAESLKSPKKSSRRSQSPEKIISGIVA